MTEPQYPIQIKPYQDGFDASIPALKGCVAYGETPQDALETLLDVKAAWLEIAKERGWCIPESQIMPGYITGLEIDLLEWGK